MSSSSISISCLNLFTKTVLRLVFETLHQLLSNLHLEWVLKQLPYVMFSKIRKPTQEVLEKLSL